MMFKDKNRLSVDEVKEKFDYNPQTGQLIWKIGKGIGKVVGSTVKGYRRVILNGKSYFVHRLIWVIVKGRWPEQQIDHINNDGLDNRIENLREANHQQNRRNMPFRKNMRYSAKGIRFSYGKYSVRIHINKKDIQIGRFETLEEAVKARLKAEKQFFGEFAPQNNLILD